MCFSDQDFKVVAHDALHKNLFVDSGLQRVQRCELQLQVPGIA